MAHCGFHGVTYHHEDHDMCPVCRLTARVDELEDLVKRSNKASKLEDLQRIAELEADLKEVMADYQDLGRLMVEDEAAQRIAELERENKMLQRIADNADRVGRELREQLAEARREWTRLALYIARNLDPECTDADWQDIVGTFDPWQCVRDARDQLAEARRDTERLTRWVDGKITEYKKIPCRSEYGDGAFGAFRECRAAIDSARGADQQSNIKDDSTIDDAREEE